MAKTKALISFAVTAKLICDFVFAYAKSWFSHDAAHITVSQLLVAIYFHVFAFIDIFSAIHFHGLKNCYMLENVHYV